MIMIKKSPPTFYDAVCPKCRAEMIYQLEDIQEEDVEVGDNPVLNMIIGKRRFVVCPCCGEKILAGTQMGIGMFGGGQT